MAELAQGTWTLESSENFDEYMKEVGVGMVMRKMAGAIKPNTEISVEGNKWTIKTLSTLKSTEINFTLDEEFDETTADGRKVKTTASLNGNTLTAIQKGSPDSTLTREFSEDTMKLILTAGDVKCTRIYKRVTK